MVIPAAVRSAIAEHARAELPNEACGLLLLEGDVAVEYVPGENASPSPYYFELRLDPEFAALVSLGEEESAIAGLRRRRILMDSPRVLARDDREAQSGGRSQPPSDSSSDASDSSVRSEPRAPIS